MKVLCLIDSLGSGGAQRQLCTLAVMLKKRGLDVSVLTYHPDDFFLPMLREVGIDYACIQERSLWKRCLAIRRILCRGNQDVVLAFLDGPVLYTELAAIPHRRWGLVVSERNAIPVGVSSRQVWLRQLYRIADYITTNSHTNRLMIEHDVPALKNRMVTIYNTVDLDMFARSTALQTRDARRLHIVVAASYWRQKNPKRFIDGLALARARLPDRDICLDWYGKSPCKKDGTSDTVIFDEAYQAVRSYDLERCVRLNSVRSSIHEAYCEADAVALPSLFEGLPNTICEAMACGRPLLMSNVCDAGNLVRNGYNGFLFDPTSPEDIAGAIVRLASLSIEDREVMGRNGRRMAEYMFAPATFVEQYLRVLTAAAARQRTVVEHWLPDVPESAYESIKQPT